MIHTAERILSSVVSMIGGASMVKFLIRRTMAAIPVLFAIMVVTFGMSQALPGGPFDAIGQRPMPDYIRQQLEERYGLDKPVFFNAPRDGSGSNTVWGETHYAKGGFGEETFVTGKYEELDNGGITFYRDYDLVRWDSATNDYVTYEEYPHGDWQNGDAINTVSAVGTLTASLSNSISPLVNVAAIQNVTTSSVVQTSAEANLATYRQECVAYGNAPGWSLISHRSSCQTVGGNSTGRIVTEVTENYIIDPLDSQFWGYLWNVVNFDFGPSLNVAEINEGTMVIDEISVRLPVSMKLGLVSLLFGFAFGIPLGVLAAIYHNSVIDYTATFFAILGASTPNIVLAPILIIVFTVELGLLDSVDPLVWRDNIRLYDMPPELLSQMILPVIALGTGMSAGIARLTRASLLQVLSEDYIRTARAKGLRERSVIYIHALKNSLIPVATILGPLLAAVLTGAFIVERIFVIPGLGESFIDGVAARDYTTIMAVTLLFSVFLIAGNILVDVIYTWLDPRIRFN